MRLPENERKIESINYYLTIGCEIRNLRGFPTNGVSIQIVYKDKYPIAFLLSTDKLFEEYKVNMQYDDRINANASVVEWLYNFILGD